MEALNKNSKPRSMSSDDGDIVNHGVYLPEEIMVEILLRSPIKSLLRFRSVCKTWHALIDSPSFINRHTTTAAATKNHRLHLIRNFGATTDPTLSAALLSDSEIIDLEGTPSCLENREEVRIREDEEHSWNTISGPVNGVYCIMVCPSTTYFGTLILWNPGNRQFHVLPKIPRPPFIYNPASIDEQEHDSCHCELEERENSFEWGCGFDPSSNDYKIIGIGSFGDYFGFTWFHLYSLSTNTWKLLDPFSITTHHPSLIKLWNRDDVHDGHGRRRVHFMLRYTFCRQRGVYFNGVCHWLCREWTGDVIVYHILSFDFGSELFGVSRIPKSILEGKILEEEMMDDISIVDGCIAVVVAIEHDMFDVCVMKEYGVDESWMRAYRISLNPKGTFHGIVDDQFFVREDDGWVVSYRLGAPISDQEPYAYCWVHDKHFSVLPYRPSLVPLMPGFKEGH